MSEAAAADRDPAIKLFGRMIAVVDVDGQVAEDLDFGAEGAGMVAEEEEKDMQEETTEAETTGPRLGNSDDIVDVVDGASGSNDADDEIHQENGSDSKSKLKKEHADSDATVKEKILKKPDKILPCPRCDSMDTKFCYYNNYNVNQPRHFCKNCQRYWTAGGTMRNVPVGAGRRKNKHSASHYRHIVTTSEGMLAAQIDVSKSPHGQILPSSLPTPRHVNGKGTVLKFGADATLCESMTNALNLGEQKIQTDVSTVSFGESKVDQSCTSSLATSGCLENPRQENVARIDQTPIPGPCIGMTPIHPMPLYPGPPWAATWNPGWNNVVAMAPGQSSEMVCRQENGTPTPIPWNPGYPLPVMAAPTFVAPAFPFPLIPTSFLGCMAGYPNSAWNVPWLGATTTPLSPSSSTSNSGCSGSHSPKLGKHCRDAAEQVEEKAEKSLWVPKTLRIDDPEEAAKSSIWATLGIKHDQTESDAKGRMFKSFKTRSEDNGHQSDTAHILHANPAALSRSQNFQEGS